MIELPRRWQFPVLTFVEFQIDTLLTSSGIVEKLSDIKVKNSASKCLLAFAEHVNLGFVLDQALGPILALKSPKALADAVSWVQKAILDFGLAGVSVQRVVLALKTVLANPNQGARTAAISCLGSIHSFSKSGKVYN